MSYINYLKSMSDAQLAEYAARAGVSIATLRQKYMRRTSHEVPRRDRLVRLTLAARGEVDRLDVLDHFYPPEMWRANPTNDQETRAGGMAGAGEAA